MCGRYVLKASPAALQQAFGLESMPDALEPRYNLAPLQAAPIILQGEPRALQLGRWGLLPHWAKDTRVASRLINARAETLTTRTAFKPLVARHRCVVPCDGFYEWRHEGRASEPHFIHAADGGLLAMAGLWSRWRSGEGAEVLTFTIITTAPNALVRPLHNRMPALLDDVGRATWLEGETDDALALLGPWVGRPLAEHAVSTRVNAVGADDAACIERARTAQLGLL